MLAFTVASFLVLVVGRAECAPFRHGCGRRRIVLPDPVEVIGRNAGACWGREGARPKSLCRECGRGLRRWLGRQTARRGTHCPIAAHHYVRG